MQSKTKAARGYLFDLRIEVKLSSVFGLLHTFLVPAQYFVHKTGTFCEQGTRELLSS